MDADDARYAGTGEWGVEGRRFFVHHEIVLDVEHDCW